MSKMCIRDSTQTVLKRVVQGPVFFPLPVCFQEFDQWEKQLRDLPHTICWEDTEEDFQRLLTADLHFSTMGRGLRDDPLFFHGVAAAALFLCRLLGKE